MISFLLIHQYIEGRQASWLSIASSQNTYAQGDAFTSLYERSPTAYLIIKTDGTIVNTNPAAVNLLQGEMDTMNGKNVMTLVSFADSSDASVLQGKIEAGNTVDNYEAQMQTLKGQEIWTVLSVHPYLNSGERLLSLDDITGKKQVDTAKSEFVALATHQLRTPIAAIRWNVELLERSLRETQTEKQVRYLGKIERNVHRMINLINDFLSVSKLEMGTFAASEAEINLNEFVSSSLDEFAEKISEKQISVVHNGTPSFVVIRSDSRLFHIIVSNLLSNAVKYLQSGGQLTISYALEGEILEIVVADDGIGIPEEEVPKLFSKFFRASNAQSHQTEGTGLGLYIVKQSVEQLGGSIDVVSGQDAGAKFIVKLPVGVVKASESE